jgi:hypothetical protein
MAQPEPQPQRTKVQDVSKSRDTRVERLVVDTNALIKRVRLDEVAQQLYTVPSVLVRPDKRPRGSWSLRSAALTARILPVRFGRPRSRTIARQIWSSI